MPRKSPALIVEEHPGERFSNLADAQKAARAGLASDLAETIRRLLLDGLLINVDGKIIPNPERNSGQ